MNPRSIVLITIATVLSIIAIVMSTYNSTMILSSYREFIHQQASTKQEFLDSRATSNAKFAASNKRVDEVEASKWSKASEGIDAASVQKQLEVLQQKFDELKKHVLQKK